jgi:hypothetical protein
MNVISDENKIQFYKYLNGDISVWDLEDFIYKQSDLAQQLDDETYSELISFNYKEKNGNRLQDFYLDKLLMKDNLKLEIKKHTKCFFG